MTTPHKNQEEKIKGGTGGRRVLTILIASMLILGVIYVVMNFFVPEADNMVPGTPANVEGDAELESSDATTAPAADDSATTTN